MTKRFYGYGVVDKDNNPWFDDNCVSRDDEDLRAEVEALNADYEILGVDDDGEIQLVGYEPPAPYRVVRLEWVEGTPVPKQKEQSFLYYVEFYSPDDGINIIGYGNIDAARAAANDFARTSQDHGVKIYAWVETIKEPI